MALLPFISTVQEHYLAIGLWTNENGWSSIDDRQKARLNVNKQFQVDLKGFWPFLMTGWYFRDGGCSPLARPGDLPRGLGG
jgi:hypothetical protein